MTEPRSRTEPRRAVLTVPPETVACDTDGCTAEGLYVVCGLPTDHNGDHFDRWDGWWRYDEEEPDA